MSAAKPRDKPCQGFTLAELLVVLSIASLLLSAALPSVRHYLHRQQVISAASQFLFALNLARSEAIRRGTRVDLAPRDGSNWQRGWVVFVRAAGAGSAPLSTADELIHSHAASPSALQITTRLSDRSAAYIAYNGSGRSRTNTSVLARQWGSWQFAMDGHVRLVRVTLAGRARLCDPADDSSCRFSDATESADAD